METEKSLKDPFVESPILQERYTIGTNRSKVDAHCPIDGTQLISIMEYDFSAYSCLACQTFYQWGNKDPASLQEQAREHLKRLKERARNKRNELERLEVILQAGKLNGLL